MTGRVSYDEFAYFAENAAEFGFALDGPPAVERRAVTLADGRTMSALVWGADPPGVVLIHGGAQNAHTWDTVALALDRPLLAPDLPGHGHSDQPAGGAATPGRTARASRQRAMAADMAEMIDQLAPDAAALVGMSLGGITSLHLTEMRPDLVRRLVLVDITPGVTGDKAKAVTDFVDGPATFASFDDILARTIEHNPTRTEASLRRGILHNAEQLDDGTWRWRYRRFDEPDDAARDRTDEAADGPIDTDHLWDVVERLTVPVMLVRGMRPQSVVDDADEAEFRRRRPDGHVEHVAGAGHSVQGDAPIELARLIADFVDGA